MAAVVTGRVGRIGFAAFAIALGLTPLLGSDATAYRAGLVLIVLVAALGLHVLVNWAGELSLAHIATVGLPAFAVLAFSDVWHVSPVYLLPVGIAVGAATGTVIGLPALRADGLQVALVTLVAGFAVDRYFFNQPWLVGSLPRHVTTPTLGTIDLAPRHAGYAFLFAVALLAIGTSRRLYFSKLARAWFWVREDPEAASAFGIAVSRYRLLAYAVSGCFGGLAGAMYAGWVQTFSGGAFHAEQSFTYLLLVVIAGPGLYPGVVASVVTIYGGQVFASQLFGNDVGDVLDAVLAYGGPLGLISVIVHHEKGLNGLGRSLVSHRIRPTARPQRSLPSGAPEQAERAVTR